MIPEKILADIAAHCKEKWDFDFTHGEIQALCEEGDITTEITEGWPDTDERGMFMDVLAKTFTGDGWWPMFGEPDRHAEFPLRLVTGYYRWKWGDLHVGDYVILLRDGIPTQHRVKALSYKTQEEIHPGPGNTWVELEGLDRRIGLADLRTDENPPHQIVSDGATVWINDREGTCLGRFSRYGIDVHSDFLGQSVGVQCLDCKPAENVSGMTIDDWTRFKDGMLKFHNVVVGDHHTPKYLR